MGLDQYLTAKKYVSGYDFGDSPPVVVVGFDDLGASLENLMGDEPVEGFKLPDTRRQYEYLVGAFGVGEYVDPDMPSAYVEFTVGYWRKANQIHQWFVDNVQAGRDECEPHYVTREQLGELRDLCKQVLASSKLMPGTVFNGEMYNAEHPEGIAITEQGQIIEDPRVAHELLPTASGFFFGSTDYDEWYFRDLEDTVKQIDRALSMPEDWSFEYRSSW